MTTNVSVTTASSLDPGGGARTPGWEALLTLAHLRNGDTYARPAAGFGIGVATAWRYVREAVALLATAADDLAAAMDRFQRLAYAILDGTLIPIDRVADQKPYCSGKHKRHGVNVQVIANTAGRLVWASTDRLVPGGAAVVLAVVGVGEFRDARGLKTVAVRSGVAHGGRWKLMYGKRQPDGTQTGELPIQSGSSVVQLVIRHSYRAL